MNDQQLANLMKRLDLIIGLLTTMVAERGSEVPVTSKIMLLADAGLGPAEIGRIVGKERNYVSSILSQKRKGRSTDRSNGNGRTNAEVTTG